MTTTVLTLTEMMTMYVLVLLPRERANNAAD
jgi:hypothetical protein